jgi:hypothetical protein
LKKLLVRLLLVLAGVAGLTIPTKAQELDKIVVKIPFQFVAAGQTFPAGEYKISRLSDVEHRILLLSSRENGAVVMFPTEAEDTPHDRARVAFATVGDQHFLSRIETANYVYTLSVPRTEALLAATPKKGAASTSSGSN